MSMIDLQTKHKLIQRIADDYALLPQVEAVALGGSASAGNDDSESDVDLYVYLSGELSVDARRQIANHFSDSAEVGNERFEPGDEWIDEQTGIAVDVMFRSTPWLEQQLARVLDRHQASVGYSTCLWYNVLHSRTLFDRNRWYAQMLDRATRTYPEPLKKAIIEKNFPLLRDTQSSYLHQLERAVVRDDWISIHHRTSALLASYFDVLFAINEVLHPGEKKLLAYAETHCKRLPPHMKETLEALLFARPENVVARANALIDGLELVLNA